MADPKKTPIAAALQGALPLPVSAADAAPEAKHDLVLLAPTPELNPRNQVMKEIAARANADADAAASETMPVTDDDGLPVEAAPAAAPEAVVEEPAPAAEAAPAAAAPAEVAPPFDPNAEIEVVIDGKPVKVKGSQVIERGKMAIQKEIAADYKLELATRLLKEAEGHARAATQPQAQPQSQAQTQTGPTDEQLAEAIQFGTQEKAAAAIAELTKRGNGADTIKKMLTALPQVVQQQLALQEGISFAKSEYADLLADPYLQPLFVYKEQMARQAGDNRPPKELYKAIGEDMRTHFNRPKTTAAASAAAPATTREQKVAAKAAAPAAPKLASARMEGAAEARPPTREEIFEKMRRARGQGQQPRTIQ